MTTFEECRCGDFWFTKNAFGRKNRRKSPPRSCIVSENRQEIILVDICRLLFNDATYHHVHISYATYKFQHKIIRQVNVFIVKYEIVKYVQNYIFLHIVFRLYVASFFLIQQNYVILNHYIMSLKKSNNTTYSVWLPSHVGAFLRRTTYLTFNYTTWFQGHVQSTT